MSMSTRQRPSTRPTVVPSPRRPADDEIPEAPRPEQPEQPPTRSPWPEPWRSYRGARARTEFWDEATATWVSRGPVAG